MDRKCPCIIATLTRSLGYGLLDLLDVTFLQMPHEATVEHTDVFNNEEVIGAHMRGKETWSKSAMSSESRKQITYSRPLTPEKATHNFDDDNSSDEGACDQPIIVDGTHKINGAF